jgi:hypothetical protein
MMMVVDSTIGVSGGQAGDIYIYISVYLLVSETAAALAATNMAGRFRAGDDPYLLSGPSFQK